MLSFTLKRALGALFTLFLLALATFVLLRVVPGGPFDSDKAFPPEVKANIDRRYGLDQPLLRQFVDWLSDLARGDLRESFQYEGRPVTGIIRESLGPSFLVGGAALLLGIVGGLALGLLAAWKRDTWIDAGALFVAASGLSLPTYLIASLGVVIFALQLGWLPPALWEEPTSAILPILTLAIRPMAMIARLARSSLIETLGSDYVRTAFAKGLSPSRVLLKHALKNSLIPVITLLGPLTANLLTGSFLVETVFQIPGLGKHFVSAVLNRDYPLVMGMTLTYGALLLTCNLGVDLLYGWIDPRIRVEERGGNP